MHTKLSVPEQLHNLRIVHQHLVLGLLAEQTGQSKSSPSKYERAEYKDISLFVGAALEEFYRVAPCTWWKKN